MQYFSPLNVTLFLMLSFIGSNNIYVFHGYWMKAFEYKSIRRSPALRLTVAYKLAKSQIFTSSSVSIIVFMFTCLLSGVMPVQAFGVYAFTNVFVVYLQSILMMPIIYSYYEQYFMNHGEPSLIYQEIMKDDPGFKAEFEKYDTQIVPTPEVEGKELTD